MSHFFTKERQEALGIFHLDALAAGDLLMVVDSDGDLSVQSASPAGSLSLLGIGDGAEGDVLKWSDAATAWVAGVGGAVDELNELTDVDTSAIVGDGQDGYVLTYNHAGANFTMQAPVAGDGGATTLGGLGDVDTSGAGAGAALVFDADSGNWVVGAFSATDHDHDGAYLAATAECATATTVKQGQWDTAFGWGDHSAQGYATSTGIPDGTTNGDILSWLDGAWVAESAPVHDGVATVNDIAPDGEGNVDLGLSDSNWNEAHAWGDHAAASYLTAFTVAGIADGQGIAWNEAGAEFLPVALGGGGAAALDDLDDVTADGLGAESAGAVLEFVWNEGAATGQWQPGAPGGGDSESAKYFCDPGPESGQMVELELTDVSGAVTPLGAENVLVMVATIAATSKAVEVPDFTDEQAAGRKITIIDVLGADEETNPISVVIEAPGGGTAGTINGDASIDLSDNAALSIVCTGMRVDNDASKGLMWIIV